MENVERVQYQAALAITGAWNGSSRTKLYEELGWESLSDRRRCRRVLQIHKIYNNQTPYYLTDKLPPKSRSLSNGNNRNTFRSIICKSNRYMNSFFRMPLPLGILLSHTLTTFHLLLGLKII